MTITLLHSYNMRSTSTSASSSILLLYYLSILLLSVTNVVDVNVIAVVSAFQYRCGRIKPCQQYNYHSRADQQQQHRHQEQQRTACHLRMLANNKDDSNDGITQDSTNTKMSTATTTSTTTSSYDDSDNASKGLVSSLTSLVNWFSGDGNTDSDKVDSKNGVITTTSAKTGVSSSSTPPTTSNELLERICNDYTKNNYLWTGNIDASCFDQNCKFTDPTISFDGLDTFVTNTQNLVPIVKNVCGDDLSVNTDSILLNATLTNEYVETRWNMVGNLTSSIFQYLPFDPQINVIGRTKFWYTQHQDPSAIEDDGNVADGSIIQVYFYDEEWEVPAYQALLQIITPAGTFPNSVVS